MKKTLALVAFAGIAAVANADVLAQFTFETSLPLSAGPHAAEVGTGNASAFHATSSTYGSVVGNGSSRSFSSNGWSVGDYYQFTTSTVGYTGITFGWDHTSSGTGPRDFVVLVSNDGVNFTNIGSALVLVNGAPNTPWSSTTYNPVFTFSPISAPALADNQGNVTFRIQMSSNVSANGGTVASAGTSRVDNIIIEGTLIPAPGALALVGLGGLVAGRRRR